MKHKATLFVFFLLLAVWGASASLAGADTPRQSDDSVEQQSQSQTENDCRSCHQSTFDVWADSPHGHGLTCEQCHDSLETSQPHQGVDLEGKACLDCHTSGHDPTATDWAEDGFSCATCHSPLEEHHPDRMMPTDRSAELCGQCHVQALYDWRESLHGETGIACVSCHRQHGTTLRKGDVSEQCATCHGVRVEAFAHSEHGDEGLDCADCHLAEKNGRMSQSPSSNHTFVVTVDVCVSCHNYQLHEEAPLTTTLHSEAALPPSPPSDAMNARPNTPVSETPSSITDTGVMMTAVLLTIAAFIILGGLLSPTLTRLSQRLGLKRS